MGLQDVMIDREGALNALLADYAAGHLEPALHALVAAHLELRPENRAYVSALEAAQAEILDAGSPQPLRNRAALLDRIFSVEDRPAQSIVSSSVLPKSLFSFVGKDIAELPWRSVLPGLKEYRISDKNAQSEASLLWIRSGRRMPAHTHEGSEVTLVLKGGFTDSVGHYARGEIAIADGEVDHRPVADDDCDCICFAVTDAPVRLTGPLGRMLRLFTRH